MSHILLLVASVLITATSAQTLTEVLQSQSDLSSWLQLIKPYWNDLDSLTNITFFAPSNDAVTNYFNTPQISGCASTDVAVLKALTYYHVVSEVGSPLVPSVFYTTLLADSAYSTLGGNETIIATYVDPSNSSVVDRIYSESGQSSKLIGGPLTFQNGVIYVVDHVLQLPMTTFTTLINLGLTEAAAAFWSSDMDYTLEQPGLGLFVPTNEAFERVGVAMLSLTGKEVKSMMSYHLFNGSQFSAGAIEPSIPTLQGTNLSFTEVDINGTIYVNNAFQLTNQIWRSKNAHIFTIDQVLNPSNPDAPWNSTAWPSGAIPGYNLSSVSPFTLPRATPVPLCKKPDYGHHSRVGAIAGGVVGGVLGLCLVGVLIWFLMRRRRQRLLDDKHNKHATDMLLNGHATPPEFNHKAELVGTTMMPLVKSRIELDAEEKQFTELSAATNVTELSAEEERRSELPAYRRDGYVAELEGTTPRNPSLKQSRGTESG